MTLGDEKNILKYVGDFSQIMGIKDYTFNSGKAKGVRALEINNGDGLTFTVLPDRGMDIANLSYKSINMSYISKTGIVGPQYFENKSREPLRSFFGGFLTTCGLRQAGIPCIDEDEELCLHGRFSNLPADEVCAETLIENDMPLFRVSGKVHETKFQGENLMLHREIRCKYGGTDILIDDVIENRGDKNEPLMMLYHFNFGYPLLSGDSYMIIPTKSFYAINKEAEAEIDKYFLCQEPTQGYIGKPYMHDLQEGPDGETFVAMINPKMNMGISIQYNKAALKWLMEWKMLGEGDYVVGLEPANSLPRGRSEARQKNALEFIKPYEKKEHKFKIDILYGEKEVMDFIEEKQNKGFKFKTTGLTK